MTMTPQEMAEACARAMWNDDSASQRLGMVLYAGGPGAATVKPVRRRLRVAPVHRITLEA